GHDNISEDDGYAVAGWKPDEAGMSKETARDALNIGGIDNSALVNYIAKCIAVQYTFIVKYEQVRRHNRKSVRNL
ncbi:hypothetical protein, partial [Klebsiella pneumoniae]|uniref:hypothetical protein n=1 Tax=Klebsiella pneumoniae TaxID=573 RepID=UPI003968660B